MEGKRYCSRGAANEVDHGEYHESLGVSVSNFESRFVEQSGSAKDYSGEFLLYAGSSMPWNPKLMTVSE
jgi:hypothetical protein